MYITDKRNKTCAGGHARNFTVGIPDQSDERACTPDWGLYLFIQRVTDPASPEVPSCREDTHEAKGSLIRGICRRRKHSGGTDLGRAEDYLAHWKAGPAQGARAGLILFSITTARELKNQKSRCCLHRQPTDGGLLGILGAGASGDVR